MTALPISKRGTITIPPDFRRQLGLNSIEHPMILAEIRDGGIFLRPASASPVREIPLDQIQEWITKDEKEAEIFWKKSQSD